jgi:O-acetyl-ADP-ribose deacetylase (regulator of RNase III)
VRPLLTVVFTPPVGCVGDYNQDGGVDGADVEAFYADWESGDAAADLNQDGGVDGADVESFFAAWENGC